MLASRFSDFRFACWLRRWGCACLLLGVLPLAQAAETLRFCMEDRDIRPWITQDGKGLNIVLLDRVAMLRGLRFEYLRLPWKRCLDALKANDVDGALGASFKPERLNYGSYPGGIQPDPRKRLNLDRYVVVRRLGAAVSWDGVQFSGLDGAVGTQLGYSAADYLRGMHVAVDEGSPGAIELLRKLQAGYIAAAAILEGEVRAQFADNPRLAASLEILPAALVEKPYYLLLSHRLVATHAPRAEAIWNTIETVRESREYQQLEKRGR